MPSIPELDLDAYLSRIQYAGALRPDVATLSALTRAHTQSIAFENIDVLLGNGISLDPQQIFDKLVTRRRGGYCFEQNILFQCVLRQLGFVVTPSAGRVRLGVTDRQMMPARTHMFLKVDIAGDSWLTDVGFGSYSLTAALALQANRVQNTPHGPRRLLQHDTRWFHQGLGADGQQWVDLYEFEPDFIMYPRDQKVANWYTQTHPDTHFTYRLSVARAQDEGGRVALLNRRLRIVDAQGQLDERELSGPKQLAEVLNEVFYLDAARAAKALWKKIKYDA